MTLVDSFCRQSPGAALLAALLAVSSPAGAGEFDIEGLRELSPPPGTVIDSDNLEQSAQLIDPEFAELIAQGCLSITVGEPLSFEPHPNYVAASRDNGSSTTLGDAPGVLLNYVAGRPFPGDLDENDPRAGEKLVWNMRYGYAGDGGRIPEMYWQYRDMRSQTVERELEFSAAAMRFMYRTWSNRRRR